MTNKSFVRSAALGWIRGPSAAGKTKIPVNTTRHGDKDAQASRSRSGSVMRRREVGFSLERMKVIMAANREMSLGHRGGSR